MSRENHKIKMMQKNLTLYNYSILVYHGYRKATFILVVRKICEVPENLVVVDISCRKPVSMSVKQNKCGKP